MKLSNHLLVFNNLLYTLLCISVLGISCVGIDQSTATDKPNIVFILADDLGWADLACYGNQFNESPHIDQLADEGRRFSNAYAACPVCSPTRASIQSGQYPARVGITDFITGHWRPYEKMIVPKNRTQYLPSEIVTIAESLQSVGYATGYFGKWHLGNNEEHLPGNQGYDDWRVHTRGTFYNLKSRNAIIPTDDTLDDEQRVSEVLTDYSIEFIERHKDDPFFLLLAHYDVHVQLDADLDLIQKYLDKDKPQDYPSNAIYAAMVEHVDRSVGRVVSSLKQQGLEDNTIVIFYSDNGGLVSRFDEIPLIADDKKSIYTDSDLLYVASSNKPLRAEKGTVYEGGIREPLIIKWPSKIKASSVSNELITSVDFYPTLLNVAGAQKPAQTLDGIDILADHPEQDFERTIYWHYPVYHHDVPASAIRKGDWKLIEYLDDYSIDLFDLNKDIGEQNDVSDLYPDKANELQDLLVQWRADVKAELPIPNPDFSPQRRKEWGRHPDR